MHLGVVGSDPAAPSNPGLKTWPSRSRGFGEGELLVMVMLVLIQEDNSGVDIVLPQQGPLEPAYFSQPTKVAQKQGMAWKRKLDMC